jgi:hypothetical protein
MKGVYLLIRLCSRLAIVLPDLLAIRLAPAVQALACRYIDELVCNAIAVSVNVPLLVVQECPGTVHHLQHYTTLPPRMVQGS